MERNRSKLVRRLIVGLLIFVAGAVSVVAIPALGASIAPAFTPQNAPSISAAADATQAMIVLISVIVAYIAYLASIRTTARQNTLDRIFQEHIDKDVVSQRAAYIGIRDDPADKTVNYAMSEQLNDFWATMARDHGLKLENVEKTKLDEWRNIFLHRRTAIFAVLNRYETFAIGISTRAIDEEMYKRWWKTTLIHDWYQLRPVIERIRKKNARAFIMFEALARRWEIEDGAATQPSSRSP